MKTLIIQPEELCNPLRGEHIHTPIQTGEPIMPMDEFDLVSAVNLDDKGVLTIYRRYRVRVIHALVRCKNPRFTEPEEVRRERMRKRLELLSVFHSPTEAFGPQAEPDHTDYEWNLLCDPIEEKTLPFDRSKWRLGDHGTWCSITVSNDPRIYCIRKESLFKK